jgi:hypothetical protein
VQDAITNVAVDMRDVGHGEDDIRRELELLTNGATGEAGSMFEQSVSYEAAYLAKFPSTDEDLPTTFRWAVERRGRCYTGAG